MDNKIWAILVHLTTNICGEKDPELIFDEDFWHYIVDESEKAGINTIVLDVGDAIEFASCPEIAVKGAWSRKKLRDEMKLCKEKGITLIPKLNFSTNHHMWLGEYTRMVSTNIYYKVCSNLIREIYELFDHPQYIHIGMDEENAKCCMKYPLVLFRQKELYWHDLRFFVDCVREAGAKPWIWHCPLFDHGDEYGKHFDADEAIISPWYYLALREENYTSPEIWPEYYYPYYKQEQFVKMNLKYVEEDPTFVKVREEMEKITKSDYKYIPCASVYNKCEKNAMDLLEFFKENAPDDNVLGYMTAPWYWTLPKYKEVFDETFKTFKEAKEKYYG